MMVAALLITLLSVGPGDLASRVEDAANASIRQAFGLSPDELDVEVVRVTGPFSEGESFVFDWPAELPSGSTQIRIENGKGDRGWALLRVRHYALVAHAARDVDAGEDVAPGDITFERIETTGIAGRPLTMKSFDRMASGQLIASRRLSSGRPLRMGDLTTPPVIQRGEQVLMDYERGGIVFRIACTAREDGRDGDAIRLYSSDTRTTYRARVIGAGSAEWIETL